MARKKATNTRRSKSTSKRGGTAVARTPRSSPSNKKYDWVMLQEAFVQGIELTDGTREWPTLKRLAELHGVNYNMMRQRSSQHRWMEERTRYQTRFIEERRHHRAKELAKEAVDLDKKALNAGKLGLTVVTHRLGEIAKEVQSKQSLIAERDRYIEQDLPLPLHLSDLDNIDARELETLSRAAQQFHNLGRIAMGEDVPRDVEEVLVAEAQADNEDGVGIQGELLRDDPTRVHQVLDAIQRSGILELGMGTDDDDDDDDQQPTEPTEDEDE
jgi:hypothetical protein